MPSLKDDLSEATESVERFERNNLGRKNRECRVPVSARECASGSEPDSRVELYEFCRGYGSDSCLLVALNVHFRTRLAESMEEFVQGHLQ